MKPDRNDLLPKQWWNRHRIYIPFPKRRIKEEGGPSSQPSFKASRANSICLRLGNNPLWLNAVSSGLTGRGCGPALWVLGAALWSQAGASLWTTFWVILPSFRPVSVPFSPALQCFCWYKILPCNSWESKSSDRSFPASAEMVNWICESHAFSKRLSRHTRGLLSHSEVLGVRTSTHEFEGDNSAYNS